MKRREFVSRACAGVVALSPALSWTTRYGAAPWLLVPMDDAQSDHLKAYGLAYRALKRGAKAEWFLNYRSGAFLLPGDATTSRDAAIAGVTSWICTPSQPRLILPCSLSWVATAFATLDGIAKPMPTLPPFGE